MIIVIFNTGSFISIGSGSFSGLTSLSTVAWQGTATINQLGYNVFRGCPSITSVNIPSVTTWLTDTDSKSNYFSDCTSLVSISVSDGESVLKNIIAF